MIHKHVIVLICLITGLASASGSAQPSNAVGNPGPGRKSSPVESKELGDPAPPLTVSEWIKGKPVKIRPGTNIYAIVFCPLTKAGEFALTNLNALQREYQDKGLITVIISDESPEELRTFVQLRGADINFTVAADGLASRTTGTYQDAFNQFMLPRAYVVGRDGNVLWHGHPLRDGMGEVVDEIVSGRYNLEQTKKRVMANQQMEVYLAMARQDDPGTAHAGWVMLMLRTNDAPALCDLAFQIATAPFLEHRDAALANAALDRAAQLAATNATDIAVDRAILLFQTGQEQAGLARARQALTTAGTDADKREVNTCIHAMEARLAAEKGSQASSANSTNSTSTTRP